MFGFLRRRAPAASRPRIGIGTVVLVKPDPDGDAWEGEPCGLVVAPGDAGMVGYPGLPASGSDRWLVAFDGLAWTTDGRGPFERASIASRFLEPLPVDEES